ncbi:hypothetical protein ACFYZ9_33170 [Streptomyces sp. NPDC001691]|uniref:hypothetical protein n=1 Tax=unclassified Streptomyces TaxID=2593676 RepID=UPI000DEB619C|nr:hypothetical protein [Streptomyces sp. SDr-06]RCH65855.1 hypothetical protein DT019_25750 [Streptomyces sp. SDr-06]
MSDFRPEEESLARALKRAAEAGGRQIVPEPAERVAERGLRRRRRTMAALAVGAVCLLAGSGAALGLRLQQAPPVTPASTPSGGPPSTAPGPGLPTRAPRTPVPDTAGTPSRSAPSHSPSPPPAPVDTAPAVSASPSLPYAVPTGTQTRATRVR